MEIFRFFTTILMWAIGIFVLLPFLSFLISYMSGRGFAAGALEAFDKHLNTNNQTQNNGKKTQ